MPTYDYACSSCGDFEVLRSLSRRDEPCSCPHCGALARRVIIATPQLSSMTREAKIASAINERSAHAPRSNRDIDTRPRSHPQGCGCCSSKKSSSTVRAPDGSKSFAGKRPWMISH